MLRILLADDHALVRIGISQIIKDAYPDALIEEVNNASDIIKKIIKENWDIIISDIDMPGRNGLEVLQDIKKIKPKIPVLFLSIFPETLYAVRALKGGASGYLNKDADPEELIKAIDRILLGRTYVTPVISEKLVSEVKNESGKLPHELLSEREMEVFLFLAKGKSLTEIGKHLNLNINTISTYRAKLMQKLNCQSNADIVMYGIRHKFISI